MENILAFISLLYANAEVCEAVVKEGFCDKLNSLLDRCPIGMHSLSGATLMPLPTLILLDNRFELISKCLVREMTGVLVCLILKS